MVSSDNHFQSSQNFFQEALSRLFINARPLVGKIHLKISSKFLPFDIVNTTIGANAVANAQINADCTLLHFAEKNTEKHLPNLPLTSSDTDRFFRMSGNKKVAYRK